jgi:hypothetical protein
MSSRNINTEVLFKEEQRFRHLWLWIVVILASALPWIGLVIQVIFRQKLGNNPAPDWVVILIWLVFGIGLPLFFYSIKLITEVRKDGIHLRFFPFHRKFKIFHYNEIESYTAREYKPIREYGGWGIRYVIGGIAYNVYGNKGLQLVLKNKKKILVGTQKPEEFYQAINKAVSHKAF